MEDIKEEKTCKTFTRVNKIAIAAVLLTISIFWYILFFVIEIGEGSTYAQQIYWLIFGYSSNWGVGVGCFALFFATVPFLILCALSLIGELSQKRPYILILTLCFLAAVTVTVALFTVDLVDAINTYKELGVKTPPEYFSSYRHDLIMIVTVFLVPYILIILLSVTTKRHKKITRI